MIPDNATGEIQAIGHGKIVEAREWAARVGIKLYAPAELVASSVLAEIPQVEEDGHTYRENAQKKAHIYAREARMVAFGDDTGLEVRWLGGRPGIFSARYAGIEHDPKKNVEKLLYEMSGATDRQARFICTLVLLNPISGDEIAVEGTLEGTIAHAPRGGGGFGYDSIFEVAESQAFTLAELKVASSIVETHRTRALQALFSRIAN